MNTYSLSPHPHASTKTGFLSGLYFTWALQLEAEGLSKAEKKEFSTRKDPSRGLTVAPGGCV